MLRQVVQRDDLVPIVQQALHGVRADGVQTA